MTWGKLCDKFWRNRKVTRLARRKQLDAVGFLALAISYASERETDGILTEGDLEDILPWHPRLRRKLVRILVDGGSLDEGRGRYRSEWRRGEQDLPPELGFHDLPEGVYLIHDYLDHNKSNALREIEKRGSRDRVSKHRRQYGGGEVRAA